MLRMMTIRISQSIFYNSSSPPREESRIKILRAISECAHALAQTNLGAMYELGRGVPQDYVRAHMWLNLAAASLSGDEREKATSNREIASKKMTSAQIAQAQEMARKCQASNFKNCD
jgi:uncharacterized protein